MRKNVWVLGLALLAAGCSGTSDKPAPNGSTTAPSVTPTTPAVALGTLYYLAPDGDKSQLVSWKPGGPVTRLATVASSDALASLTVSPDGKQIAWIASTNGAGKLMVANVDGTGQREVLDAVDPYCVEPSWIASGKVFAMLAEGDNRTTGTVTLSGAFTPFAKSIVACHFVASTDGTKAVWLGDDGVFVGKVDGSGGVKVPQPVSGDYAVDPEALSDDGARIAVHLIPKGEPGGDVARDLNSNVVLDVATGKVLVSLAPGELKQIRFLPAGATLLRLVGAITVQSGAGQEVGRIDEPAELRDASLLTYVP